MNSRLKNLREMLDLTQAELARDLDISRQSLIALEKEKCKPSIGLAREISDFFEMPIELIFPFDNYHKESKMPWSGSPAFLELSRMHQEIEKMFDDSFFDEGREAPSLLKIMEKRDEDFIKIIIPLPAKVRTKEIKTKIEKGRLIVEIAKNK